VPATWAPAARELTEMFAQAKALHLGAIVHQLHWAAMPFLVQYDGPALRFAKHLEPPSLRQSPKPLIDPKPPAATARFGAAKLRA
jgi:hypothetical protein